MIITVSDKLYIDIDAVKPYLSDIAKSYTYKNPEYYANQNMGFSVKDIKPLIEHFAIMQKDNRTYIVLPRGSLKKCIKIIKKKNPQVSIRINDQTSPGYAVDVSLSPTTLLEPQQLQIIDILEKNGGGLVEMIPGGGKTISALGFVAQKKLSTLIIVHEHRLRTQWEDEIKSRLTGSFSFGRFDGDKKIDGDICIGLIQTVANLLKQDPLFLCKFGIVIVDECFTGNSKVLTHLGYKKIKNIQKGEYVLSFNELTRVFVYKKVLKTIKKKNNKQLIQIKFDNNKKITCTEDHKIATTSGWVEAKLLSDEHSIMGVLNDYEGTLQRMWKLFYNIIIRQSSLLQRDRASLLLRPLQKISIFKNNACNKYQKQRSNQKKNDREQPHVQYGKSNENDIILTKNKSLSENAGREWKTLKYSASAIIRCFGVTLGSGVRCTYKTEKKLRVPYLLQAGYWKKRFKDRGRSRWVNTLWKKQTVRSEEGFFSNNVRLASSKIVKRSYFERCIQMCTNSYVYDLTVEDNHNYVVNGILVHNCHHVPADMYTRVINSVPSQYKIGLTGTVARKDGKQFLLLDSIGEILASIQPEDVKHRVTSFEYAMVNTDAMFEAPGAKRWINGRSKMSVDHTNLLTLLTQDVERNEIIIKTIEDSLKEQRVSLVISTRVEHCKLIHKTLLYKGYNVVLLIGETRKSTDWGEIRQDQDIDCIIAQDSIASEGLDFPKLSALHLTCPSSNFPKIKQKIGRIRRVFPGKPFPKVYDYVDNNVYFGDYSNKPLLRGAQSRKNYYQQLIAEYGKSLD